MKEATKLTTTKPYVNSSFMDHFAHEDLDYRSRNAIIQSVLQGKDHLEVGASYSDLPEGADVDSEIEYDIEQDYSLDKFDGLEQLHRTADAAESSAQPTSQNE